MIKHLKIYSIVFAIMFLFGCIDNSIKDLKSGDICSIVNDSITYGVIKILAIEDSVMHLKLYRNKYIHLPDQTDLSDLSMEPDTVNLDFGVAHLVVTKHSFIKWKPAFLKHEDVSIDESKTIEDWKNKQINNQ